MIHDHPTPNTMFGTITRMYTQGFINVDDLYWLSSMEYPHLEEVLAVLAIEQRQ